MAIRIKPSKQGSLHRHLGVPKGKKIPASMLRIKPGDSKAIRKKKQFAINAKKWKHPEGGFIYGEPKSRMDVRNNYWVPQTRTSIYYDLANAGMVGTGADSLTYDAWSRLSPQQTLGYLNRDAGFDYTYGNTANPGGVKYWKREKIGDAPKNRNISKAYFKAKEGKYSLGGDIIGGAASGAALGPWGALAGAGIGLVKGLIGNSQEKKQEEMQRQIEARNYALQAQAGIGSNYLPTFAFGGPISAEIEKEEVVVPPNGVNAGIRRKFNLPTHKNKTGENLISAEPGSFVLSDKLMYDDNRTMAQAYEEAGKKVDKYQKVLDSPKSTSLAIKTAKRNLTNVKKLQQQIIEKNQLMLSEKQGGTFQEGGEIENKGWLSGALSLAPVVANLFQSFGKPEQLNARDYYNPYAGQALSEMSNRRFNAGPALAANANAAAAAMGNVVNQGGSRGMVNANRQALLSARMMSDNAVTAQAQNVNNQYLGEQAQFRAGIGQQMANTKLGIKDINDRNRAAKRGMFNTAMGQLGQFGQTQQLMYNQKQRDTEMMKIWKDYLDMMRNPDKPSMIPITGNESYLEQRGWQ